MINKFSSQFSEAIESTGFELDSTGKTAMRRQELLTPMSRYEAEVQLALANLKEIQDYLGKDSVVIGAITENDLRHSKSLRTSVLEYKEFYFYLSQSPPKSFTKTYESDE